MTMEKPIYPGATLGLIGIDFNGSALISACKQAGYNVGVYVDRPMPSVTHQADFTIVANYREKAKLHEFGENVDAVIYATTQVDAIVLKYLAKFTSVPQGVNALEIVQDRLMERAFLDQINVNVAPYVTVISLDDVYQSIDSIGYPALLKPIQRGLGERSMRINRQTDISRAADFIDAGTYLLESWIDHTNEYTMVASTDGEKVITYPLAELVLDDQRKLIEVKTPADVDDDMLKEMKRIMHSVASALEYRGVFSVNFYVTDTGNLYVKGLQPGLSAIGNVFDKTANVSQYDQLLRTVVGMPMHQINHLQPALMMVVRKAQEEAIHRQWLLKDNWQYRFMMDVKNKPTALLGFVWITGMDSVKALQNQADDTEVWSKELPTENGGETLTGDPRIDVPEDDKTDETEDNTSSDDDQQ